MAKRTRKTDALGKSNGRDPVAPTPVEQSDDATLKLRQQLETALGRYDRRVVEESCQSLVDGVLRGTGRASAADVNAILSGLRKQRYFEWMRRIADAWLQTSGQAGAATYKVRRQYVQALIDEGDLAAGLSMAEDLRREIEATDPLNNQWSETCGLIGRCHKQWFVQTGRQESLERALAEYRRVYDDQPYAQKHKLQVWHGVNVVAMAARAAREGMELPDLPDAQSVAQDLLEEINNRVDKDEADAWDMATAMEACVALGRTREATTWAAQYVRSPYADAFELTSTVRQLKEIWGLDSHSEPGSVLMPLLESELLKRQGGEMLLKAGDMSLAKTMEMNASGQLEKVFGRDSYRNWTWLRTAMDRCQAVGRLETEMEDGQGTGFLVRGGDLHHQFGDELLLITNAHVLCDDAKAGAALRSTQAFVRFEVADGLANQRFRVKEILDYSLPAEFDFTLVRLTPTPEHCPGLQIATAPPRKSDEPRMYAIGFPLGGSLAISLHDNLLIDFDEPKVHYRTPTNPGSSGSPIFDEQWKLVALHHAGGLINRLRNEPGTYEANEGIWLESIKKHLRSKNPGGPNSDGEIGATTDSTTDSKTTTLKTSPTTPTPPPSATLQAKQSSVSPARGKSAAVNTNQSTAHAPSSRGPAMPSSDLLRNLQQFMRQVTPEERLESLRRDMPWESTAGKLESVGEIELEPTPEAAASALEKIALGRDLDQLEQTSLEAIVLPRERPVVFIEDGTFGEPESPWEHFGTDRKLRQNIERAIQSIGRVELPTNPSIPFGGTAFVVGENLLMTNRHVAELFAVGLGRQVRFRQNYKAGWDYLRERKSGKDTSTMLAVRKVRMIHPYWDMALLEVVGLKPEHKPLRLSVAAPESLVDRDVAVIGYPAKDWRNNTEMQDRIFKRTYNVKRLQPGKIRQRDKIESFSHVVSALTHDSSTLGGNSGSAVVDAATGDVIGLHFAGLYLKANYAVPTYELARDAQVVDAGVNFGGTVRADTTMRTVWRGVEATTPSDLRERDEPTDQSTGGDGAIAGATKIELRLTAGGNSLSIPITVSASLPAGKRNESPGSHAEFLESLRAPKIFPSLDTREGYDPSFLAVDGGSEVPLPELTEAGRKVVAKLDNGSHVLKYHKFSVVMHKIRRMALFTAANVDWRDEMRKINGRKPSRDELTELGPNDREMWVIDERIPGNQQLPDVFFTRDGGNFDKGHLVRRDDVAWGESFEDMQMGNGDTYHTTNCSPQVAGFNQSAQGKDNWGDLENMVQRESRSERVIVFNGPVLSPRDDRFEGRDLRGPVRIQIPKAFWKIIVANGENGPQAFGFVLEQDLSNVPVEFAVPIAWRSMMRKISEIEKLLFGLVSLDWLKRHDVRR